MEEIRKLYEAVDYSRVGLCIDTQHAFASGLCDFQSHESVVKLYDESYAVIRKGISLIHLNDSKKPFGSCVDRHEILKQGYIWNQSDVGLKALLRMAKDVGTDIISETSDPMADVAMIENYMKSL
jgi:deoxyribonuclease-4